MVNLVRVNSALVFDLDGLILNSLPALQSCMMSAVTPFVSSEEQFSRFREFDRASPGLSRFEKARYFASSIAKESKLSEESIYESIIDQFGKGALNARLNAQLDRSIYLFSELRHRFKILLLTNCENSQLPIILTHHRIFDIFTDGALGTPPSKSSQMINLLERNGLVPSKTFSISDSKSDYDIAVSTNVRFVFVSKYAVDEGDWCPASEQKYETLLDFFNAVAERDP